jgi:OOP family OmpA-OmpF porin
MHLETDKMQYTKVALLALFLLTSFTTAFAAEQSEGYWYDSAGEIWRDRAGDCWDTRFLTEENSLPECTGEVVDTDGDGVPDSDDKCPETPAGAPVDAKGCQLDSDGDGVVDINDKCPDSPAGVSVDANGCQLDSDRDGVVDAKDKCPDSPADKPVDANGCTIEKVVLKHVNFASNSSELTSGSFEELDKAVAAMNKYPELRIEIAAHTDSMGEAGYNQSLSEKRANSVRAYMIDKGIAANRMEAKGYGESRPIADNATKAGRQTNRRVELKVLD